MRRYDYKISVHEKELLFKSAKKFMKKSKDQGITGDLLRELTIKRTMAQGYDKDFAKDLIDTLQDRINEQHFDNRYVGESCENTKYDIGEAVKIAIGESDEAKKIISAIRYDGKHNDYSYKFKYEDKWNKESSLSKL